MYHVACQLAEKFGVVVANDRTMPELVRRIRAMGCYDRVVSVRPLNVPINEEHKDQLEATFLSVGRRQIDEDDAQLLAVGHATMLAALGFGSRERLEKKLGVPVLEAAGIAMRTLEMLVILNVTHSKRAYPSPPD